MPGYDRTGPKGAGPRTGGGYGEDGHTRSRRCGRGSGGSGAGRGPCGGGERFGVGGHRQGAAQTARQLPDADSAAEAAWLRERTARLKRQLETIDRRLDEMARDWSSDEVR